MSAAPALRSAAAVAVVALMLAGLGGGLHRAGAMLPVVPASAVALHAMVLISGFFGAVIGIERAVALKWPPAWGAPLAAALGGWCLLAGQVAPGAWALVLASIVFSAGSARIVRQQFVAHHVLLLVAALCWVAATLRFALGHADDATLAAGFAFLVLTIAAERLEMTRLMRRKPLAQAAFGAIVALLLLALAGTVFAPRAGHLAWGLALALLGGWLALNDLARRTIRSHGLTRYMATCLLLGYAWLIVAGACWIAMTLGAAARDAALHALGLGFIISMVMAHAPVILPAVARLEVAYTPLFYAPLALLHGSLLLRLAGGALEPAARTVGASLNAVAIVAFGVSMLYAASLARRPGGPARRAARAPRPDRRAS